MLRLKLAWVLQDNKILCLAPLLFSATVLGCSLYLDHAIFMCFFLGLWSSVVVAVRSQNSYQAFNLPRKLLVRHTIITFLSVLFVFMLICGAIFYFGKSQIAPILCFFGTYIVGAGFIGSSYRSYLAGVDDRTNKTADNAAQFESKRWLGIFPSDNRITKPQTALFLYIYRTVCLFTVVAIVGGIIIAWYDARYSGNLSIGNSPVLVGLAGGPAVVLFLNPLVYPHAWISFGFTRVAYARTLAIKMLYCLVPILVFFLIISINVLWQGNYLAFLRYLGVGFALGLLFVIIAICVNLTNKKIRVVWFPFIIVGMVGIFIMGSPKYQISWWAIGIAILGIGVLWLLVYSWFGPFIAKRLRIEQKQLNDI